MLSSVGSRIPSSDLVFFVVDLGRLLLFLPTKSFGIVSNLWLILLSPWVSVCFHIELVSTIDFFSMRHWHTTGRTTNSLSLLSFLGHAIQDCWRKKRVDCLRRQSSSTSTTKVPPDTLATPVTSIVS